MTAFARESITLPKDTLPEHKITIPPSSSTDPNIGYIDIPFGPVHSGPIFISASAVYVNDPGDHNHGTGTTPNKVSSLKLELYFKSADQPSLAHGTAIINYDADVRTNPTEDAGNGFTTHTESHWFCRCYNPSQSQSIHVTITFEYTGNRKIVEREISFEKINADIKRILLTPFQGEPIIQIESKKYFRTGSTVTERKPESLLPFYHEYFMPFFSVKTISAAQPNVKPLIDSLNDYLKNKEGISVQITTDGASNILTLNPEVKPTIINGNIGLSIRARADQQFNLEYKEYGALAGTSTKEATISGIDRFGFNLSIEFNKETPGQFLYPRFDPIFTYISGGLEAHLSILGLVNIDGEDEALSIIADFEKSVTDFIMSTIISTFNTDEIYTTILDYLIDAPTVTKEHLETEKTTFEGFSSSIKIKYAEQVLPPAHHTPNTVH
jgi:hypothetical protein